MDPALQNVNLMTNYMAKDSRDLIWYHHTNVLSISQVISSKAKRARSVKQGRKNETALLYWGTEAEWTRVLQSLRQLQVGISVCRSPRMADWRNALPHLWTTVCKRSEVSTENYMKTTSFEVKPLKSQRLFQWGAGESIVLQREGTGFERRVVYTHSQYHKPTSQQQ